MKKLIKIITRYSCFGSALLLACSANADFSLEGDLTITFPTGATKKLKMPISYTSSEYDHLFTVGDKQYKVGGRPEKYSFATLLQKSNFVWIQEFAKGPFESFEWEIGDHKLKLYKEVLAKPVKGDYILSIDDKDYFFQNKLTQIDFLFNEEGIEAIETSGFVASLGLNKAKDTGCKNVDENASEGGEQTDEESTSCEPETSEE